MNILLTCNWQDVFCVLSSMTFFIILFIVLCVVFYLYLKYWKFPNINNAHEYKMKKDAFEREKEWAEINKVKASTDEVLKQKVQTLESQKTCLELELDLEKKQVEKLKELLKLYKEAFEQMNIEINPKN